MCGRNGRSRSLAEAPLRKVVPRCARLGTFPSHPLRGEVCEREDTRKGNVAVCWSPVLAQRAALEGPRWTRAVEDHWKLPFRGRENERAWRHHSTSEPYIRIGLCNR